jgi:hypothetical protein
MWCARLNVESRSSPGNRGESFWGGETTCRRTPAPCDALLPALDSLMRRSVPADDVGLGGKLDRHHPLPQAFRLPPHQGAGAVAAAGAPRLPSRPRAPVTDSSHTHSYSYSYIHTGTVRRASPRAWRSSGGAGGEGHTQTARSGPSPAARGFPHGRDRVLRAGGRGMGKMARRRGQHGHPMVSFRAQVEVELLDSTPPARSPPPRRHLLTWCLS